MKRQIPLLIIATGMLGACSEEPQPRTVTAFLENTSLLEAAMVRCAADRAGTRYDAECINAREAVKRIEAKEEATRRAELEASSESKRRALRRTQEAAAAARRRATEAARLREEAEYLAQFGVPVSSDAETVQQESTGNTPQAVIPEAVDEIADEVADVADNTEAEIAEPGSDLDAIRDELRRRNDETGN